MGTKCTRSAMNELDDSVHHLSISSPVGKTKKKRRKRKHRKKTNQKERTFIEKACDDGRQDVHIPKYSLSADGCMSEGQLQDADNTRCSETPQQDEPRTASACAGGNIEPVQLPDYATGAIPKKHKSVKTESSKKLQTNDVDQSALNDGAAIRHDSGQTLGTSAAVKSNEEQKESKTMTSSSQPLSLEELAVCSTAGSEVELLPQRNPSSIMPAQGVQQMAVKVAGRNNVIVSMNNSPGATINLTIPTDTRQPCYEGNELESFGNSGTKSVETGELYMNEILAPDMQTNNEGSSAADRCSNRASDRCEAQLKTRYMTTGRYVQTVPRREDHKRDMKEIYTNLQWTRHGISQSSGYTFLTTCELGPKRIIVAGTAGLGKSTLLCKIAYDWATGDETLSKYKVVFLLTMHSLDETSKLVDAIFVQLLDRDTDVNPSDLEAFIRKEPQKVLVLLDGFNELMTSNIYDENPGSILQLLNRKIGRECYVLITTRPSHMKDLVHESLIQEPYTRIDVLGFASQDIEKYVMRYFPKVHDKADQLLLRIKSQGVLYDMAKRPMFLLLMCLLWGEKNELPDTMASLYKTAMNNVFKRKSKKAASTNLSADVLTKIGEIALHGLLDPKIMASFQEEDFESNPGLLEEAMQAGVFTSKDTVTAADVQTSIEFIHGTIHEYCAALYIQSLVANPEKFKQTLQEVKSLTKDNPMSFEYLFRFCCVNAECMIAVLQMLQDCQDHRLGLQCYFECQSDELPPVGFINSVISNSVTISCWNNDCIKAFLHFLQQIADQKRVEDNIYLDKVQTLKMITCNLFNFSPQLARCIDKMTSITVLHLTGCSLTSNTMKPIAKSLGKSHLVELDLSWNEGLRDSIQLWFSSLQRVRKLVLRSCSLTGNDIQHIAVSQKEMSTIVELDLSGNPDAFASEESVLLFCYDLVNLTCLSSLTLESCSITGASFQYVANALGQIKTSVLAELNLTGNAKLGGSAELWSLCLKELKRVEKMDFRCCSIEAGDVSSILASGMPSLLCLKLSGNHSLGGNTNSWCLKIPSSTRIEELELKDCNMDLGDFTCLISLIGSLRRHIKCFLDVPGIQSFLVITRSSTGGVQLDLSKCCLSEIILVDVLKAISNKDDIVELALGMNEGLGGSAIVWSKYITDLMKLQHVDLRGCNVLSRDIEALATSLSVVVELNLSENDALGGCAEEWAGHLAQLQHLKKLHLSKCSLRSRDVKDIFDIRSLVELDLSINGLLRNTGEPWVYLRYMKQLHNLDLSLCSLITADAEYIAETLSCMPSLIRLNLSGNCALTSLDSLFTKFHSDSHNVFVRKFIDE
ncbi:NACHT, LRR and PYD domains-containing protein 3-like [Asterias amurensis]|uniref:NACHT, LRR and PYD domains-containing protein 3-like n=1 Tax=Asterias amurensis TaxID=7602 RepID=UPI003AB5A2E1